MSETLRPCTLGEILDRTAQLYRRNFWLFAGVAALPIGTMIVIVAIAVALGAGAAVTFKGADLSNAFVSVSLVAFLVVAIPVYVAAGVFSFAGLTEAAVSANRGEKLTIRAALKSVRPRFWRYLWFLVLQGIAVVLIPGAIAGGAIAAVAYLEPVAGLGTSASATLGFVAFLAVAACIGVIIWRALGYSIGFAVCVAEQRSAWESLKRSWRLSKGTRGRIFVMFLLVFALAFGERYVNRRCYEAVATPPCRLVRPAF